VPAFSAPVVVTIAQRPSEPASAPARAAPVPRDRDAIGRELQKELRRVGCYEGELNGAWTTSTRQAMKAFMDRVNASLPTEVPDAILLTMVRGYSDRVCGKPCPAGQGLGEGGRCVPNAILVRAAPRPPVPVAAAAPALSATPKPAPAITGWTTTTASAPSPTPPPGAPPPEGRMALAGPQAQADPAALPPAEPPQAAAVPPAPAKRPPRAYGSRGAGQRASRAFHDAMRACGLAHRRRKVKS
jgi:hypothetical protein